MTNDRAVRESEDHAGAMVTFDAAWLSLQTSGSPFSADDRAAGTRDLLAQRIIEIAQRGERDRQRILEEALAQFESSKR